MNKLYSNHDMLFLMVVSSFVFLFFLIQILLNNKNTINKRKKDLLHTIKQKNNVFVSQLYNGDLSNQLDFLAFILFLAKINNIAFNKKCVKNKFNKINIEFEKEKTLNTFIDFFIIDLFKFEDDLGRTLTEKDIFRFVSETNVLKYKNKNILIFLSNHSISKVVNGKEIVKMFKFDKECFNVKQTKLYFENTFKRESQLLIHAIKKNKNIEILWHNQEDSSCICDYVVLMNDELKGEFNV